MNLNSDRMIQLSDTGAVEKIPMFYYAETGKWFYPNSGVGFSRLKDPQAANMVAEFGFRRSKTAANDLGNTPNDRAMLRLACLSLRLGCSAADVAATNTNPAACVFIFDWKLEASQRLGITPCGTAAQCEAAVPTRWVVFNPFIMFGHDLKAAFRWFCHWVFEVSKRGVGKKVLFVDELWKFVDAHNLPAELEKVARMGRAENLELLTATQHPRDYHRDLRAEVTEWVCFNMSEPAELEAVRPYFRGVDRVADLPRGSFIAYNRESGEERAGKLF